MGALVGQVPTDGNTTGGVASCPQETKHHVCQSQECFDRFESLLCKQSFRIHLPDCLALRWLFAGWSQLHQQHAGAFLAHCLNAAEAETWEGRWESRLSEPFRVTDAGTLRALPLPIIGATQSLLDAWNQQYAPHALTLHNGADAHKNQQLLRIRPEDQLEVPLFAGSASLMIRHETFQVVTVIYHLGHTVKALYDFARPSF